MPESATASPSFSGRKSRSSAFHTAVSWLLRPRQFHYKLLFGTTAAVLVIIFLVVLLLSMAVRKHRQDGIRANTVEVLRLSSIVENDIAQLQTYHRGFLLTREVRYTEPFQRRRDLIRKRMDELASLIITSPIQRKRVMRAQELVLRWIDEAAQPGFKPGATTVSATSLLSNNSLAQAREILQSLQNEEQIVLNQRTHEQEWAAQSTQILDFLPRLERAVIDMDNAKRGFLLTNDNSFVEAYRRALGEFYTYDGYVSVLLATAPQEVQSLNNIRSKVENWINSFAAPEIDARRHNYPVAGVQTQRADQLLQEIEHGIADLERTESAAYETRSTVAAHQRLWSTSLLGGLALLALTLLISSNTYSFVLMRRHVAKLQSAEIRLRATIESILDGMVIVDSSGTIRVINPAAERLFGCASNEMVGHQFIKLVPKAYTPEGDSYPIDWEEFLRRTGTTVLAIGRTRQHVTFPVEISLSEMVVDQTPLYLAMIRDVTERKRFERELAAEKESLAVTLRSIGDGVITTDVKGRVLMINPAGEALTGWTTDEAKAQPLESVFKISIDLAAQARAQRNGYRSEAHSILSNLPENATLVARDGAERVIEQVASPIRDRRNEIAGVVLVFRDITARERSESERRKAESLEQLGLLAGGIAHDFNNLLTAIIGNISLASLLPPAESRDIMRRLGDAKNASMRARDLAQQLLTFARGGAPIKRTASIGRLVKDTVSFSLRGSHSRSQFSIAEHLWAAEIDTGQISQVIANLVVNADQAMSSGGTLFVTCENFRHSRTAGLTIPELPDGDYVKISIKDEGIGIPENYLKRIFDPYFTTKAKGNGLGLATTYSIVKHHKGIITVESEPQVGSTFTIYLPAMERLETPQEVPRTTASDLRGRGRILIVDDEEAIRALVEFTLTHLGYEVAGAESAMTGVELYRQRFDGGRRFDLVILDLTLPGGMGGKEAMTRLMQIDPTVNAIVSSGYAMDATMSCYKEYGFRGVIAKPYEAAELGRVVQDAILSKHTARPNEYELQPVG